MTDISHNVCTGMKGKQQEKEKKNTGTISPSLNCDGVLVKKIKEGWLLGGHEFGPPCSGHSAVANANISHETGIYAVIPSQLLFPLKFTHSGQSDIRGVLPCQGPVYWNLLPRSLPLCWQTNHPVQPPNMYTSWPVKATGKSYKLHRISLQRATGAFDSILFSS